MEQEKFFKKIEENKDNKEALEELKNKAEQVGDKEALVLIKETLSLIYKKTEEIERDISSANESLSIENINTTDFKSEIEPLSGKIEKIKEEGVESVKEVYSGIIFDDNFFEKEKEQQRLRDIEQEKNRERIEDLDQKYISTLGNFPEDLRDGKIQATEDAYNYLQESMAIVRPDTQALLKLKLARFLQNNDSIEVGKIDKALKNNRNFLKKEKGSLYRALEIQAEKDTAYSRMSKRERAEIIDDQSKDYYEASNFTEGILTTDSGKVFVENLLNKRHLSREGEDAKHCLDPFSNHNQNVGENHDNRYYRGIMNGDIEIMSVRDMETETHFVTIEYDIRHNAIAQTQFSQPLLEKIRKGRESGDYTFERSEELSEILESIRKIKETKMDNGKNRNISFVDPSLEKNAFGDIHVNDNSILSDYGELTIKEFLEKPDALILKTGNFPEEQTIPKELAEKILEQKRPEFVMNHLKQIKGLDAKIAEELVSAKQNGFEIANNINLFKEDPEFDANSFAEKLPFVAVLRNQENFDGINIQQLFAKNIEQMLLELKKSKKPNPKSALRGLLSNIEEIRNSEDKVFAQDAILGFMRKLSLTADDIQPEMLPYLRRR